MLYFSVMRLNCNYILKLTFCPPCSFMTIMAFGVRYILSRPYISHEELYRFRSPVILTSPIEPESERRANLIKSFFFKVQLILSRDLPITRAERAMSIIHV